MINLSSAQSAVAPLGAGDLIDRAIRFYRRNFRTLVWIAVPPILLGTLFSIGWTILGRQLFSVGAAKDAGEMFLYSLFSGLGSVIIWSIESVATFTVMGGAARNFVRHLLFGEPISFRETYRNVGRRFFGLVFASILMAFLFSIVGVMIFYFGAIVGVLTIALTAYAFSFSPFLTFAVSLILGLVIGFGTLWLIFLVVSRFAYVPQVMLVENQGVFAAVGRSASLASGNVKRLIALFLFTIVATYSALAILYIPLALYAWANGVEIFSFGGEAAPAWYEIAGQVISQTSLILLTPVWMIGLCLLYVDERVRHEGYDIELMAARRLGDIPKVAPTYANPLQPALANQNYRAAQNEFPPSKNKDASILGLN